MGDIKLEQYKSNVEKAVDRWKTKITAIGNKAKAHRDELKKLRAIASPTPADKKKIDDLVKALDKLEEEVDTATLELKVDTMLLEVPKEVPKPELVKLPDWLKAIIKAKGIPLGNGVSIAPEVKFDFDKRKVTYIGVKIKW